jgi:uncharacterized repeat protein (TIGR01451 family)
MIKRETAMVPARNVFKHRFTLHFGAALIALAVLTLTPAQPKAQEQTAAAPAAEATVAGLWLTTSFPAFAARPGEEIAINLRLTNKGLPPQRVPLEVSGLPEGWEWRIEGDGRPVSAAIATTDEDVELELNLTSPEDAETGAYAFTITGSADGTRLELPMEVTLTEIEPASLELEPALPALRGTPRSTFDFQVTVRNEGQKDTVVNLLSQAPAGFEVTFKERYGTQELTSLPLKAGESKNLSVSVDPADSVAAGQYPVLVGVAGDGAAAETQLVLDVTGQPTLALSGPGGRLSGDAVAGEERRFTFVLENTGTAPARDISLSASPPSGWTVTFEPEEIAVLAAGETAEFTVAMTPSNQAIAGDYVVSIRANGDGVSDNVSFRVTVRTSTLWGVVGLGVIAAAVAVLAFAVTRYGRR